MMASDGNLVRLVGALFKCVLFLHITLNFRLVEGDCIWYGLCSRALEYDTYNCFYNGSAKPVQEETRYILDKYCPQFASGPVCCDNEQLNFINTNIESMAQALSQCSSCMDIYMQHICGMTCSPDQSDFIKPITVLQFNSTHEHVKSIEYYLSVDFKEAIFNSCAEIRIPVLNRGIVEFCGGYDSADCTADFMLELLHRGFAYDLVPLEVNYKIGDVPVDGYIPYNLPAIRRGCNDTDQGFKEIEPTATSRNDANDVSSTENTSIADITEPTAVTSSDYLNTTENNSITNKLDDINIFNTTEQYLNETCSRTFNCELLYQRKFQVKKDYYSFKQAYLSEKLVLLREQTEAFKTISMEFVKIVNTIIDYNKGKH